MLNRARIALVAWGTAGVAAAATFGLAGSPAAAQNVAARYASTVATEACHPPGRVGGVDVYSLHVKGIGCEAAANNTRNYLLHHVAPEAFTCSTQHSGTRNVVWSCHRGDKSFHAAWRVL